MFQELLFLAWFLPEVREFCQVREFSRRAVSLEQLQGKVLRWVDSAAYGAGAGAQRPLTALEGWCAAAERKFSGSEPADDDGSGALGPAGAHTSTAARLRQPQSESLDC